jgi:hypothetical protein
MHPWGDVAEPSWQTDQCLQATAGLYYTMLGLTRQSSCRGEAPTLSDDVLCVPQRRCNSRLRGLP